MKQEIKNNGPADDPLPELLKRVQAHARRCSALGRFLYEGQWLTRNEIEEQVDKKRQQARRHLLELLLLLLTVYLLSGMSLLLVWIVCCEGTIF